MYLGLLPELLSPGEQLLTARRILVFSLDDVHSVANGPEKGKVVPREHSIRKSHLEPVAPGSFKAEVLSALQLTCLLDGPGVIIFGNELDCAKCLELVTCACPGFSL